MVTYKVLTIGDKLLGGKFSPEKVEQIINSYAELGWRIVSITAADKNGGFGGGGLQELVVIFEHDV